MSDKMCPAAPDMKRPELSQFSQLRLSVVIVLHLILLGTGSFVNCIDEIPDQTYDSDELEALQTIYRAWHATPEQDSNLAGWSSEQRKPCPSLSPVSYAVPDWRGVQCTRTNCSYSTVNVYDNCSVGIIVLSLSNASIVGNLPDKIGNLTNLAILELTGNPNLSGPLPQSLQETYLNVLDVHDNNFSGPIPNLPLFWNLLHLDLSGNNFTEGYPLTQLSTMERLRTLSIGNNRLGGDIQADAFENKTQLESLDISDNNFYGALPDLNPLRKLIHLDASGNHFGTKLPNLTQFSALRTLNLGINNFTGTANLMDILNLSGSTKLTMVDLSYNQLSGFLPSWDASNLGSIQELYLHNNTQLSGTLNITQMLERDLLRDKSFGNSFDRLGMMSLSNNSITHVIYNNYIIANITTVFKLEGNPYCNSYDANDDGQRCFCEQICFVTPAKSDSKTTVIVATTTSVGVFIILVLVGAILLKNRRYKRYLQLQFEQKFEELDVKPTIFSYNELRVATRDFHEDMKLGQGSYGAVYKGVLPNGSIVAVKQLYVKTAQGLDEFSNEVVLITGMKHRNLVNLKGCCLREHQRLLVYEYVDYYDVDQILLGSRRELVSWPVRLKICLGIARGLHYLHALAHPKVIHRDIKASNVLLNKNLEPKIADFGLALLFPDEQSHIMTVHVAGTKGYLAPEYASLGQLSDKVDVYSFGVLCLEIISGQRNIDQTRPLDQVYLTKYAWDLHKEGRLMDLVDPTLCLTDKEMPEVQRMVNVSLLCVHYAAERRPTMARVVSILQSDTESEVQVLGGSGQGERLSYESLRSLKFAEYRSGGRSGFESVTEEGSSSSAFRHRGSHEQGMDDVVVAVELSEIRAR